MGTSVPAATDYLLALATSTTADITVGDSPVLVVDGMPLASAKGMFVIGLEQPPEDAQASTSGTRQWKALGALSVDEDYTIPAYINCWSGGTDQKTLRDAACQIFDAFFTGLRADLTLGGALSQWAEIADFQLVPTASGGGAQEGRRALLTFGIRCHSRYAD